MPDYRLSPKAIADLEDIYTQGLEQFGPAQADRYLNELYGRFQLLAEFPGIAGPSRRAARPSSRRCSSPAATRWCCSSGARDARIAQAYRCLYGGDGEPHIPDSVSFLEAFVQAPLSAVLIFLLLLAIKNRFKIK